MQSILIGVGIVIFTLVLQKIFGFSERVYYSIALVIIVLVYGCIYLFGGSTPNYTGNPQVDAQILKERVVEYNYDVDAAMEELMEVYSEKGLGLHDAKQTMNAFASI